MRTLELIAIVWALASLVVFVITTSWAFIDAMRKKYSILWGLGTLVLWLVVFPAYLAKRGSEHNDGVLKLMWGLYVFNLLQFGYYFFMQNFAARL